MKVKINRNEVYAKCNGHCGYCGVEITIKQMQVDHVHPQSLSNYHLEIKDGQIVDEKTHHIDNLMPSCRHCNNYKGALRLELFRTMMKQMLNDKIHYLFKSTSKMKIAINTGVVKLSEWDGVFYFERANNNG